MKKLKRVFIFLIAWFVIHEVVIIYDGLNDNGEISEYAVIYGNTVNKDGTVSDRLKARLEKGKELYVNSKVSKIFVSGGYGKRRFLRRNGYERLPYFKWRYRRRYHS